MKKESLYLMLVLIFTTSLLARPTYAADTLKPEDFKLQSWSKTIDFFDYARTYATKHGKLPPSTGWHANLHVVYINVSGFQLLYGGLTNITTEKATLTIPIQTFMEHYRSEGGKDVLMSSSFVMLLAFNDTSSALHPNSPDRYDNLYASFSLGLEMSEYLGNTSRPALTSTTTIIPLTWSDDKLNWHWGMRYTNLTAIWWRMYIDPSYPRYDRLPIAITTYNELEFTYNLTISPSDHTARLTANYVIGRMTNLWLIRWLRIPFVLHYNSTGTYRVNGQKHSNQTLYQYLERQNIKMSIVLFQNSLTLEHATETRVNGLNATDSEIDVSNGTLATSTDDGEKIFETSFGTKKTYALYNYTADPNETSYDTYNAKTRTARIAGYARNPIFNVHTALLRFIPLVVAHMHPPLYQKAKDHMLNMTYADYFYIISYPTYSGFKVKHDPTYIAHISTSETPATTGSPGWPAYLMLGLGITAAVAATIVTIVVLKTRTSRTQEPPPTMTKGASPQFTSIHFV